MNDKAFLGIGCVVFLLIVIMVLVASVLGDQIADLQRRVGTIETKVK